jgi:hypothetical protein
MPNRKYKKIRRRRKRALLRKGRTYTKEGIKYREHTLIDNKNFNNRNFSQVFKRNRLNKKLSTKGKGSQFSIEYDLVNAKGKKIKRTIDYEALPKKRYETREVKYFDRRSKKFKTKKLRVDLWESQIKKSINGFLKEQNVMTTNYQRSRKLFKSLKKAGYQKARSLNITIKARKGKKSETE